MRAAQWARQRAPRLQSWASTVRRQAAWVRGRARITAGLSAQPSRDRPTDRPARTPVRGSRRAVCSARGDPSGARPTQPGHLLARLSVIIITLNEAANIGDCLDSVAFADERIVLDSGSQDDTVAIARAHGAMVRSTGDWPGFGAQKNRVLELAQGDWVLSLDADERVPPALARQIGQVVRDNRPGLWELPRLTQFCGQWIRHCGWTPDRVARLFPRGQARFSDDRVHERLLAPHLVVRRLDQALLHYSYPTPAHYWRKLESYSQAWAQQRFERGQTAGMTRAALSAVVAFLRSYLLRLGFLDGAMG
ncbi:MAG: glycosyltransferase family 2 protein, partial [Rhodoferax sp.]|nr:glycosyltransferase family 2 protein [Rhodoferax sp.]